MTDAIAWIPYCGAAPAPAEWLGRWNFDPFLLVGLLLAVFAGWRWTVGQPARRRSFSAAWLLLVFLFVTPFCALTSALFSARVAHHVLLTAAVAPLIVASLPVATRRFGSLAVWTALQALIFWAWHSPPLYAAALSNTAIYWLMQFTLLASAVAFWLSVRRSFALPAAAALLGTMVQMGLLGALITFSASPLYAPHFIAPLAWGYAPLEDQQLAGLIMWAPGAAFYLAAALLVAARWFAREARASAAT